ncbi:hypothetical protein [Halobellus limi]|uniref:Uncharacterized protein n=1 Tax=Halobellus limi TaxID=699433 RepID=A0A1H6AHR3_9EURY|nr:hypothetical protein [Halobellus limi]QCC47562.1 hypothetical protein DV707_07775 [Halobellus limi]SEG47296.1 hypothetical protein SAMN04488133_2297 [Halobellus limi]
MSTPSRRRVLGSLATAALAASAGCLGVFDRSGADDGGRVLELMLTRRGSTLRENFVVDLGETRPEWDEAAFEATLDGEEYTTQYRKPFYSTPDDPKYAESGGTYYRLGSVVVDEVETTRPVLRLYSAEPSAEAETADDDAGDAGADSNGGGAGDGADAEGVVDAGQLPEADATAVHVAHLAARARGNTGGAPWGLVQRGGYVYRDETAVETSELLADDAPAFVRYRDRRYRAEVSRERFYEPVYRATVEPVATSPEEMERVLRAGHLEARVSRSDLSSEAREIFRAAERDGYSESRPYSDAYEAVLRAIHRRPYLDGNVEKDAGVDPDEPRLIRYGDVYYEAWLQFRT